MLINEIETKLVPAIRFRNMLQHHGYTVHELSKNDSYSVTEKFQFTIFHWKINGWSYMIKSDERFIQVFEELMPEEISNFVEGNKQGVADIFEICLLANQS